jgi:nucleotide-binding universal stress UspA family protein
MFNRILVPVDLSERCVTAVEVASELAAQSRAAVVLFHVIETIEHVEFAELRSFYERLETSARKRLEEFSQLFIAKGLEVDQVLLYGHRTKEIVDYAAGNSVDLIVMSSHRVDPGQPGHGWSSISYAVAILAPCPVLLVK